MFVLCVVSKDKKGKMQNNQDKERGTDKVQNTREYKKNPVGVRFSSPVQTSPRTHRASYKTATVSLSRG